MGKNTFRYESPISQASKPYLFSPQSFCTRCGGCLTGKVFSFSMVEDLETAWNLPTFTFVWFAKYRGPAQITPPLKLQNLFLQNHQHVTL